MMNFIKEVSRSVPYTISFLEKLQKKFSLDAQGLELFCNYGTRYGIGEDVLDMDISLLKKGLK